MLSEVGDTIKIIIEAEITEKRAKGFYVKFPNARFAYFDFKDIDGKKIIVEE